MGNMDIWRGFEKTDPEHTKDFKKSGGFGGTAIKPMYAIKRMTEVFGACGEGWGYTKPEYQVISGSDGQVMVYCTVGLWHGQNKQNHVWGVGGDFIIVKQSSGLRSDDEAFKKAFTDALMNAMKHIGMSADVHMGQFDASKYVKEEKEPEKLTTERVKAIIGYINNAKTVENFKELRSGAKKECESVNDLKSWSEIQKSTLETYKKLTGENNVVSK